MKRALVTLALVATLATGSMSCRLGFAVARAGLHVGAHVAAAALVTAIHVAAWYSVAHAVVVYPSYSDTGRYYHIQPGTRVYVVSRSADGYWCYVRTDDGRAGWVRQADLSGHVRAVQ